MTAIPVSASRAATNCFNKRGTAAASKRGPDITSGPLFVLHAYLFGHRLIAGRPVCPLGGVQGARPRRYEAAFSHRESVVSAMAALAHFPRPPEAYKYFPSIPLFFPLLYIDAISPPQTMNRVGAGSPAAWAARSVSKASRPRPSASSSRRSSGRPRRRLSTSTGRSTRRKAAPSPRTAAPRSSWGSGRARSGSGWRTWRSHNRSHRRFPHR